MLEKNKKILITGINGFIGTALSDFLTKNTDYEIIGTSRKNVISRNSINIFKIPDLSDTQFDWSEILQDVDIVIHTAARAHVLNDNSEDPLVEFRKVNVNGTVNLVKQALEKQVKRFVFLSSIGVNGESTYSGLSFIESDEPNPISAYALSKYEAEKEVISLCANSCMSYVIIRPPLVYGANAPGNFNSLLRLIKKSYPLPFGLIQNQRSMVYVQNLVSFIKTCIENDRSCNELFLVSDNCDISTKEIFLHLGNGMGNKQKLLNVPEMFVRTLFTVIGQRKKYHKLFDNLTLDMQKAIDKLAWEPEYSTAKALEITANEFLNREVSNNVA